jgi:PAS domain S-box-containing protein
MDLSQAVEGGDLAALLDTVCEMSFDSVMVTDVGDRRGHTPIVYVNDAFTELTGYSEDEVLGESPTLLQGDDTDRDVLARLVSDLEAGRTFEGEAVNYRKDGSSFVMHWRVAPVMRDGASVAFVAVQREG